MVGPLEIRFHFDQTHKIFIFHSYILFRLHFEQSINQSNMGDRCGRSIHPFE